LQASMVLTDSAVGGKAPALPLASPPPPAMQLPDLALRAPIVQTDALPEVMDQAVEQFIHAVDADLDGKITLGDLAVCGNAAWTAVVPTLFAAPSPSLSTSVSFSL
jgi:hypothetical protein